MAPKNEKAEKKASDVRSEPAAKLTLRCEGHDFEHTLGSDDVAEMRRRGWPTLIGVRCAHPGCGKLYDVPGSTLSGIEAASVEAGPEVARVDLDVKEGKRSVTALREGTYEVPEPPEVEAKIPSGLKDEKPGGKGKDK